MLGGESLDAVGVVSFCSEVFAVDVPVGALAGAGRLDVGGLLLVLPAAGHDEGTGDGRALRAVDVLRVAEAHAGEVIAGECSPPAGTSNSMRTSPAGVTSSTSPWLPFSIRSPWLVVLLDHRDPVAFADAVVDAWHLDLQLAEFAALSAVVLGAGVEAGDLLVGGIRDQRDLP